METSTMEKKMETTIMEKKMETTIGPDHFRLQGLPLPTLRFLNSDCMALACAEFTLFILDCD